MADLGRVPMVTGAVLVALGATLTLRTGWGSAGCPAISSSSAAR
jgi:hypothetical protein